MSKIELENQFSVLGVIVTDKVLDECVRICIEHDLLEEDLVEEWMAFSICKLGGADPTIEAIREFEHKEYSKKEKIVVKKPGPKTTTSKIAAKDSQYQLKVYNADESRNISSNEEFDAYNTYSSSSPSLQSKSARDDLRFRVENSPDLNSSRISTGKSPGRVFSPAGFSPAVATPSRRYTSRTNAGVAMLSHGNVESCTWRPAENCSFVPHVALLNAKNKLSPRAFCMYEHFVEEDELRNEQVEIIAEQIMQKYSLNDPQSNVEPNQSTIVTYGRVGCVGEEIFGASSVTLEGTAELNGAKAVQMCLSALDKCALFPGQAVVVLGTNPTGKLLLAEKVYCDARLPLPVELPQFNDSDGPLHIVIAAGPYTQTDTMNYQPLEDLIAYVVKEQPHVLILIGPFIDESHPHIVSGLLAETFEDYFFKIIENIAGPLLELRTQIVVVASSRDAHHLPVYPTPPYNMPKCPPNFTLVSDPATLNLGGVIVSVQATDIIKHMGGHEIEHNWFEVPNKLHRAAQHLLMQQCFYPLCPTAEEVNLDTTLFCRHGYMDVTPHILVLPSDLRYFARVIDGCLAVNPEHLAKGEVGGMFARFEVKPPARDMTPEDFVKNNIHCQLVRI